MVFDAREGLYLPQFGNAVLGGVKAGQEVRKGILEDYLTRKKINQQEKVEGLQQQYLGATDDAEKQNILGQIAVYNPEHAKGIASIGSLGNPFEGTSIEAQKANLQYQRYRAAGYSDGDSRIRAINDAASTNAQHWTDAGGNRVTLGGIPLPDVGGSPVLGGITQQPLAPYGTGNKPSQAESVVAKLPINDHVASASPEERTFVNEVMSSPNPAQAYNAKVKEHPELAAAHPQWDDTVAGHFQEINTALNENVPNGGVVLPKTSISTSDMNSPVVKVTAAKAQAEKDIALANIQPSTATKLEEKLLSASDIRSQVSNIRSSFKPEYQTYSVQSGMAWSALKDKFNSKSLSEKDQQGLAEFTEYRANAGQMFSNVLKELSGAAVNPTEFKRAEAYLPNPGSGIFDGDSPTQMAAKIKKMEEFTDKALAKYTYIRKNGFDVNAVDVDQMPKIMNDRGNAISKELSAKGLRGDALKTAVTTQLSQEFGLAR